MAERRCSADVQRLEGMAVARKIVSDFQQAMGRGDFAAARSLLRDDLSFRGPIGDFEDADRLIGALKKLQSVIERVDIKKIFADGNDVCVLFDLVTKTPAGDALVAEWYRVEDGRIAMMRAMFDARPFAGMLAKLR